MTNTMENFEDVGVSFLVHHISCLKWLNRGLTSSLLLKVRDETWYQKNDLTSIVLTMHWETVLQMKSSDANGILFGISGDFGRVFDDLQGSCFVFWDGIFGVHCGESRWSNSKKVRSHDKPIDLALLHLLSRWHSTPQIRMDLMEWGAA